VALLPLCLLWNLVLLTLVIGHITVMALIVLALVRGLPPAFPVLGQLVLVAFGWAIADQEDGTLSLAAAWTWDFALIAAAFLLGRVGTVACRSPLSQCRR
jgi:hypothetical protein